MIDFSLPEDHKETMAEIRAQGFAGRDAARYYDEHEEELPPDKLPEADQFKGAQQQIMALFAGAGGAGVQMLSIIERARTLGMPLRQIRRALGNAALMASGTKEQQEKWKDKVLSMAITEPGCGSDSKAIQTTAVLDGDEWVINGEKIFVTTGIKCEGTVVWATIDKSAGRAGIKSFIIMKGTPGFEITKKEKKLGIRSSDTAAFLFDNCRIPRENLLGLNETVAKKGAGGFRGVMKTFNMTRPAVAAGGIGQAMGVLDFVKEQLAKEGVEIDYTVGVHNRSAVQDRLIRIEADIEAATLSVLRASWLATQGKPNNIEASICKAHGGEVSRTSIQECMDILGGMGMSRDYLVEKALRDGRVTDIYEGTGEIQRLIIARAIFGYSSADLT